MQSLILPMNQSLITAGYQSTAYRNRFGFSHYGHDMISVTTDRRIWGSSKGQVLAVGLDSLLGNVVIILYRDVLNLQTGKAVDVVLRYCHLDKISVKVGDAVSINTQVGIYGNTGRYSAGAHLHIEVDCDVKNFAYSATVAQSGSIIKAGTSTTMCNPSCFFQLKQSPPERQSCTISKATYGGLPYVAFSDATICSLRE